ncbi:hypothetical protein [Neisseria animaloris]|uniref:hypothetical protein n=1 Tax=Neisseria animaloris TaxID=326522 RepID=UPI0039DFC2A8
MGRTEQYHYDYNNELTKRVFADGSAVLIERDNADRLTSHTDGEEHTTAYEAVIIPIKIPSKHNIRR